MTESANERVAARRGALTVSNRARPTPVVAPGDRPGVVIFLHGVNDPGASYATVEAGLCQGLNERLGRRDLKAAGYGAGYAAAKKRAATTSPADLSAEETTQLDDPDTYLYQRLEQEGLTHSVLIPFYWGYRAAYDEIQREVVDGRERPVTLRGQFQDTEGNRLDRHFGKNGGFFANATNNLPEMYGPGFNAKIRHAAQPVLPNTQYMGKGPHRRYFVLAAHRLAMLVGEIRRIDPNETVTIIGHSQGTLITLLAQAILVDQGKRTADTVIMVDSPYSVMPAATPKGQDTLKALMYITAAVTGHPHASPALDELQANRPDGLGQGRTGPRWTPRVGHRADQKGAPCAFPERDNRGKVYLYFSQDDSTVGLGDVHGIGTFGVPDTLPDKTPAMTELKKLRFYQRMWTKRYRQGQPVWVGRAGYSALREKGEPLYANGATGRMSVSGATGAVALASMEVGELRDINAEALAPLHAPAMFGGEAIRGRATTRGKDRPDDVTRNVALGNPKATFQWFPMGTSTALPDTAAMKEKFNAGKVPEDQTLTVRALPQFGSQGASRGYVIEREATINEIRQRMSESPEELEENSYHSAVLRDAENQRWATAMDVSIGQAHCLDDPEWRKVLVAIADWKMDEAAFDELKIMKNFGRLSSVAQELVAACSVYYQKGRFPIDALVPLSRQPRLLARSAIANSGVKR